MDTAVKLSLQSRQETLSFRKVFSCKQSPPSILCLDSHFPDFLTMDSFGAVLGTESYKTYPF